MSVEWDAEYGSGEIIIFGISARAIPGRHWCLSMDLELTGECKKGFFVSC